MKTKRVSFIVAALIFCVGVAILVTIKFQRHKLQSDIQISRLRLVVYASAITNYHATFGEWPNSLADLRTARGGMLFVSPDCSSQDAWGSPIEYTAFDERLGYGRVTSLGPRRKNDTNTQSRIEARFDGTIVVSGPSVSKMSQP